MSHMFLDHGFAAVCHLYRYLVLLWRSFAWLRRAWNFYIHGVL